MKIKNLFKRRRETRKIDINKILEGTPFPEVLEYHKRLSIMETPLMKLNRYTSEGRVRKALKLLKRNLGNDIGLDFYILRFISFRPDYPVSGSLIQPEPKRKLWGGTYGHGYHEQYADLCIVAGRLAKQAGYNSQSKEYYQKAKVMLDRASVGIGACLSMLGHRGDVKASLADHSSEIDRREEIIERESQEKRK